MKIVGQSTLAEGMPYTHLGYLAATYMKPNMALLGGGLVTLMLGVVMAFSLVTRKPESGRAGFSFVRRKSRKFLFAGVALIILGSASLAMSLAYRDPRWMTDTHATALLWRISDMRENGQQVPATIAEVDANPEAILDGWGQAMRLVAEDGEGRKTYAILSAGADREFDTSDDIRFTR